MADNKSQAMYEAKDAALGSVGFMLSATTAQSDQIRKSSIAAAKNAVQVRKNIVKLVEQFKVYENMIGKVKSVLGTKNKADIKVLSIGNILASGGNAYKEKEAEQETKSDKITAGAELVGGAAKSIASIVPTAAILALAIPFLLTPEVKEMLGSFFDGLLESLGLGKKAVDNIKIGLGITAGIIASYFSYKVLSGVYDAFMQMKKLAEVMGLLGETTATEKNKIDAEKEKVGAAGDKAKDDLKDVKKDIKKGKKIKNTPVGVYDKIKLLMDKIAPKLKSLGGNFLKALPGVGTILGIGLILYGLFDIGKDIYDMFTGSADDKDEEAEQESAPAPAATSSSQPATAVAAEPENKPSPSSATSAPEGISGDESSAPTSATPSITPSMNGNEIREASIQVERADLDLNQSAGGVNITTIDNSTTIIDAGEKSIMSFAPVYSVSVGT